MDPHCPEVEAKDKGPSKPDFMTSVAELGGSGEADWTINVADLMADLFPALSTA
jgi:hypothetical protein